MSNPINILYINMKLSFLHELIKSFKSNSFNNVFGAMDPSCFLQTISGFVVFFLFTSYYPFPFLTDFINHLCFRELLVSAFSLASLKLMYG